MTQISRSESIDLSGQYFSDPRTYIPLTITPKGQKIIDCIEPNDPGDIAGDSYDITIQTPGGALGAAGDAAMARSITSEQKEWTFEDGITQNKRQQAGAIYRAHQRCKFLGTIASIYGEMADPDDLTLYSFEQLAGSFGFHGEGMRRLPRIRSAAAYGEEYTLDQADSMDLLESVKRAYWSEPGSVHDVVGEQPAHLYVTNFLLNRGQNRNNKFNVPGPPDAVKGYHDSIGAYVANIGAANGLNGEERDYQLVSALLRSAATKAVISASSVSQSGPLVFYEVSPSLSVPHGFEVQEVSRL